MVATAARKVYGQSLTWRREKARLAILEALDSIREAALLTDGEIWSRVHDIESRIHKAYTRIALYKVMEKARSAKSHK